MISPADLAGGSFVNEHERLRHGSHSTPVPSKAGRYLEEMMDDYSADRWNRALDRDAERNREYGRVWLADKLFTHEAVDEFWKAWNHLGEPHKHGVYESTWAAFRAAMGKSEEL